MPNPTVAVPDYGLNYLDESFDFPLDAVVTNYQTGEMLMQVSSSYAQHCDDTQVGVFLGLVSNSVMISVLTGDAAGRRVARVRRPRNGFAMKIAAAVASDVGRSVFARFSNEVSYSPGVNANFVGVVKNVPFPTGALAGAVATLVIVEPPAFGEPAVLGALQLPGSGATTLNPLSANKLFEWNGTAASVVTLPPVSVVSCGATLDFVVTGVGGFTLTLTGSGTDLINGAATFALNTPKWSTARLVSDGTQWLVLSRI